jgi:hypothetical protein
MNIGRTSIIGAAILIACGSAGAQDRPGILPPPPVKEDGSVVMPDFELPFSAFRQPPGALLLLQGFARADAYRR